MKTAAGLNDLWLEYADLYPEDLRSGMRAGMARVIARRSEDGLRTWTGYGLECGEHASFLAEFRQLVRDYWGLTVPPPRPRPKREDRYRDIGGGIRAVEV